MPRPVRRARHATAHQGCAFAACALAAGLATAQDGTTEAVVISAGGAERRAFDTPYAVGVVDADALRAAGPGIHLSEALARIPGLVANNRHNLAQDLQIHSRGFGARASFGIRGMRLIGDGIPASGPDGQGQVSHLDLAGAQRIEVLRGPFSALYGASSGGVIAVVGAAPTARRWTIDLDAGSAGLRQRRLGIAAPFDGGFSLRASIADVEIAGFRAHSRAERRLAQVRLGWDGAQDRIVVVLNHHTQPAQDPLGLTPEDFAADPDRTALVALPQAAPGEPGRYDTRKDTRQDLAGISWRHRLEGGGALREARLAAFAGRRAVTQWQSIPDSVQAASPTHPGGVIDFDRGTRGVDTRLTWRWPLDGERGLQLVAGASAERSDEDRRGRQNFLDTPAGRRLGVSGALRRDERNRVDVRDLYAQGEADLAADWTATLGLRRGSLRFRSDDRYIVPGANPGDAPLNGDDSGGIAHDYANPVAALQWRARPTLHLHLSAARGFESPTFNELAYRADGQAGLNDALRPQTSRQWELGAKWRPDRSLALDAALFHIGSRDEIGVLASSGGRTVFQNVGTTRRQGAELEARWRPASPWSGHLAVTWLDASYRETRAGTPIVAGRRIAGTQRASAYAELAWRPGRDSEIAIEGRAQGRVPADDANRVFAPGHGLLALRARWGTEIAGARLELLGRIDNVADRRVVGSVVVNEGNQRLFEPAPGRGWLLAARLSAGF